MKQPWTGNIQLSNEESHFKRRQDKQVARLHAIDDALDEVRGKLIGVLKVWNERSVDELAILAEDEFPIFARNGSNLFWSSRVKCATMW